MITTAIISEYNPFHNGHKYHIDETRKSTGSDFLVSVMSGNFVQRGEPAIINKWARTEATLQCGADVVIELPCLYACSSAEYFAKGAVDIINNSGAIDFLSFGSDTGDLEALQEAVLRREENSINISSKIIDAYKSGLSYPKAMQEIYKEPAFNSNDILAIHYLNALKQSGSIVKPFTIKRKGSSYNDKKISNDCPSAQAIRKYVSESADYEKLYSIMPKDSADILVREIKEGRSVKLSDFEKQILTILRSLNPSGISKLPHVTPGLDFRLYKNALEYSDIDSLTDNTISPSFTRTRIQRLCIAALLDIKSSFLSQNIHVPYIRILGFKERAIPLIEKIKANSNVPVILRPKKDYDNLTPRGKEIFDLETRATDIYVLGYKNNIYSKGRQDYTNRLIIKN